MSASAAAASAAPAESVADSGAGEAPFKDPQQATIESDITKVIDEMPEEVQARFKAIMVLYQQMQDIDEEEEKEIRKLELVYEKQYAECYAERAKLVKGEVTPPAHYLTKFEELAKELHDDEYEALEVGICDVKEIQNTLKGVPGFWLRAMLDVDDTSSKIQEKDRSILQYLLDIKLELHDDDHGFKLTFVFEPNSYFAGTELTKAFHMSKPNVIEKCVGCVIEWSPGSDPTMEKKKKKVKKGGKKTTVTVSQKCESFFNFFETIELTPEEQEKRQKSQMSQMTGDDSDEEKDEEENDIGAKMDEDFELGNTFKDNIVPLALEYYLGVIENPDYDEDDDGDDDGDDSDGDDTTDKSKKSSKGGKEKLTKKQMEAMAAAGGKQECQQQ